MTIDLQKTRRESMRWYLLKALDNARPLGALDVLLLDVMRSIYPDSTATEVHSQLDYLQSAGLVELDKRPGGHWHAKLNHTGVDVVEYVAECPVGIARTAKYWT
ncbi:MAG: hypothetical protein Q4G13_00170 [Moraxella sp.]|nr:hypothetical protein [Moraxella sp.]